MFIPGDEALNAEVTALHHLARTGVLPVDAAERQLNTYLLAARRTTTPLARRCFMLPIADAPHHTLLPDLGNAIHRILARCPVPCALSSTLEQCLPAIRHSVRPAVFCDSQTVLINLIAALLLGLYPGVTVKRPDFGMRVRLFAKLHCMLTSPPKLQTEFCARNQAVIMMACMEYIARVLPACMPAQAAFLHSKDPASSAVFFRRVPALCDEFRQSLVPEFVSNWIAVRFSCASVVEKIARLKKASAPVVPRLQPLLPTNRFKAPVAAHWDAPRLHDPHTPSEYTLLADALGLNDATLHGIQRDVQAYPLPHNLRRMQIDRITAQAEPRTAYLRSRLTLCMHCALTSKTPQHARLRLDTLRQTLLCCHCSSDDLVSVDMLGVVLRLKSRFFVLCPGCNAIQPFHGEQIWLEPGERPCPHEQDLLAARQTAKPRNACRVCGESASHPPIRRVNHLTGEMVDFYLCQRHHVGDRQLFCYTNARQMAAFCGVDEP